MEQIVEQIVEQIAEKKRGRGRPRVRPIKEPKPPKEIVIKPPKPPPRPVGRPNETGIMVSYKNSEYYKDYYHLNNEEIICECGASIASMCMGKHLKRNIHKKRIAQQQQINL